MELNLTLSKKCINIRSYELKYNIRMEVLEIKFKFT